MRTLLCLLLVLGAGTSAFSAVVVPVTLSGTSEVSYFPPNPGAGTLINQIAVSGGSFSTSDLTGSLSVEVSAPPGQAVYISDATEFSLTFQWGVSAGLGGGFSLGAPEVSFSGLSGTLGVPNAGGGYYTLPEATFSAISLTLTWTLTGPVSFEGVTVTYPISGSLPPGYILSSENGGPLSLEARNSNYSGSAPPLAPELLKLAAVPEPSAFLLIGCGAIALLALRKL